MTNQKLAGNPAMPNATAKHAEIAFPVAFAALTMGAVAMGASPVFVRFAEIGPFASAFWRVALALPLLLAWTAWSLRRRPMREMLRFSRPAWAAGLFFAGDLIFWHLAILNTTVANATLLACLAPFWVMLLSRLTIGEAPPPRAFVGLVVCLAGAALLVGSSLSLDPSRVKGDIYGLVTSFFFGLYFLAVRAGRREMASGQLLFLSSIVTACVLLVAAAIAGGPFLPVTKGGYAALFSLGIISHAGGQGLLAIALGSLTAGFSSLVIFIEAIAAAIFGWAIFSERMGILQLAGSAAILSGIWLARPGSERVREPSPGKQR
jgi:drug/metabolite transporter (DMT)-like permease